jgi:hypothetical protein
MGGLEAWSPILGPWGASCLYAQGLSLYVCGGSVLSYPRKATMRGEEERERLAVPLGASRHPDLSREVVFKRLVESCPGSCLLMASSLVSARRPRLEMKFKQGWISQRIPKAWTLRSQAFQACRPLFPQPSSAQQALLEGLTPPIPVTTGAHE